MFACQRSKVIVDRDSMNLTLINVVLRVQPMTEPALAATLLVPPALCCALALFRGSAGRGGSTARSWTLDNVAAAP